METLSKSHSDAEILNMVDFVIDAKKNLNPLYPQFIMVMSVAANVDPREIERRILNAKQTGKW